VIFELRGRRARQRLQINDKEILNSLNKFHLKPSLFPKARHDDAHSIQKYRRQRRLFKVILENSGLMILKPYPQALLANPGMSNLDSIPCERLVNLLAQQKCVACHQNNRATCHARIVGKSPITDLAVGSRLNPVWVADWITQPKCHSPQTHTCQRCFVMNLPMKKRHISRRSLLVPEGRVKRLGGGDPKSGGQLFQELGCYACHSIHDEKSDRISLVSVDKKFQNGVLASFLQTPAQHYT
jgi:cytochrome c551/c552